MKIKADKREIAEALDYIEDKLKKKNLNSRDLTMLLLTAEESIVSLIEHAAADSEIEIGFTGLPGNVKLNISAPGEAFDIAESSNVVSGMELEGLDLDAENAIRNLILRARSDTFRYKNRNHRNTIQITVNQSDRMMMYLTLGSLVLSVLLGMLFKLILPETMQSGLNTYLLTPVKTMFMNGLKMVTGPVVFFSIISCLAQFENLQDLGKIGAKVMGMYLLTTLLAIMTGIGVFSLIKPGDASMTAMVTESAVETSGAAKISILDTIVNIVPSDVVSPFLTADMLQILFMAIFIGIAVGLIGDYSKILKDFFEACNLLFLKITTLIVKVIPLAILCSMTALVMTTGTDMLVSIMSYVGTFLLALAVMLAIYCLIVLIFGRLNPLPLLRKHGPTMLTAFSLGSSNAAMPMNMESCRKLGVSPKISSFSIPLGATVNMDGSCVYLAVAGLFLAKVYGIEIDSSAIFSMIFSIFVLSMGAPGIPGSGLICLSVLLVQLGIPAEAISLVMGVDSILGMCRTAINTTGDVAVSLVVAKTEKLLNEEKYNSI